MIGLHNLIKISDYEWEIPQTFRSDMRVPVRIFATRELLEQVIDDKSLEQAVNTATLPGLVGQVVVMPDMHQGYGFPIGGVAATEFPQGVISPGGVGYDINCGVRLLASSIEAEAAASKAVNEAQAVLDEQVLEHYAKLTEAEIKTLVVDDKWFAAIRAAIEGEVQRLTQRLAARVKELEERYAQPLPALEREVETLAAKVEGHLRKMGLSWS